MTALQKLAELQTEGDDLLMGLMRAKTRDNVAHHIRALRRWHGFLKPPAQAYSEPLAESLRMMNPHPEEWARVAHIINYPKRYMGEAHRLLLLTTATALYRLAPHLATAKPRQRNYKVLAPQEFENIIRREPLTFERGELSRLARQIADMIGCNANTAEKEIRPFYKKLKRENAGSPA